MYIKKLDFGYVIIGISSLSRRDITNVLRCFIKEDEVLIFGISEEIVLQLKNNLSESKWYKDIQKADMIEQSTIFISDEATSILQKMVEGIELIKINNYWVVPRNDEEIALCYELDYLFVAAIVKADAKDLSEISYLVERVEMIDGNDLSIYERIKGDFIANILPKIKEIVDIEIL